MIETVDLATIVNRSDVSIKSQEHPEERAARLRAEKIEHFLLVGKDLAIFSLFLITVVVLGILCIHVIFFSKSPSVEFLHWTETLLTSLVTSSASFLAGRKIGAK